MTPSLIIDLVLALGIILTLIQGWRMGAAASIFSTAGGIVGIVGGAMLAPMVMTYAETTGLRILAALGLILLLLIVGEGVGGFLGARLRSALPCSVGRVIDSLIGAVFQPLAMLLVAWLIAHPLAVGSSGPLTDGVRDSRILAATDRSLPAPFSQLPDRISAMLSESGIPPIMSIYKNHNTDVAPPNIEVADKELVTSMRPSVIHVMGDAEQCSRRLMGSGFVAAPDYVITNAHVVAGTNEVNLDTTQGLKAAEVVYYNPDVDLAVLHSPELDLPVLPWANEPATTGDDVIVMGFPESGPFTASPARVRERLTIAGPDIYASGRIEREAYTLRGSVRQGNSGGPVTTEDGQVIGVIFGAAVDDADTGYALTKDQIFRTVGDITALHDPVDTRQCVMSAQPSGSRVEE